MTERSWRFDSSLVYYGVQTQTVSGSVVVRVLAGSTPVGHPKEALVLDKVERAVVGNDYAIAEDLCAVPLGEFAAE